MSSRLLSYAESAEDLVEELFRAGLSGDLSEAGEGVPQLEGQEFYRLARIHAGPAPAEGFLRSREGVPVAHVRDEQSGAAAPLIQKTP